LTIIIPLLFLVSKSRKKGNILGAFETREDCPHVLVQQAPKRLWKKSYTEEHGNHGVLELSGGDIDAFEVLDEGTYVRIHRHCYLQF
jgi:hypothetical protein